MTGLATSMSTSPESDALDAGGDVARNAPVLATRNNTDTSVGPCPSDRRCPTDRATFLFRRIMEPHDGRAPRWVTRSAPAGDPGGSAVTSIAETAVGAASSNLSGQPMSPS
jgi:hypothetical protein